MASFDLPPSPFERPRFARRLTGYAEGCLRRPLLLVVPPALALLAGLVVARLLPPQHRASARVQAHWEERHDPGAPRTPADEATRRLQQVRDSVLGRAALERVLDETEPRPPGLDGPPDRSSQVRAMLQAVSVRHGEDGSFVIEYVHRDPVKTTLVVNRLASLLVEGSGRQPSSGEEADPEPLSARLEEARRSMEEKERALLHLQEMGAAATRDEAGADPPRLRRLEAEAQAVGTALAAARGRVAYLHRAIEAEGRRPAEGPSGPAAEIARLRAERGDLRLRYTDDHPDVQALDRRIQRLEAALPSALEPTPSAVMSSLQARLEEAERETRSLEERGARIEAEVSEIAQSASRASARTKGALGASARELESAREAYRTLLAEWQARQTGPQVAYRRAARYEVLQAARMPEAADPPNTRLFAVVGLLAGLVAGLAAALVAEARDRTVKGAEDLQELLPVALLGVVPLVRLPWHRRRRRAR